MEEQLVPLNDDFVPTQNKGKLTREGSQSSLGSDNDIHLHHEGDEDTLDYRIHAKHNAEGKTISLWHDISLVHIDDGQETEYMNFVCEIPKFTRYEHGIPELDAFKKIMAKNLTFSLINSLFGMDRKKYELATDEDFTPIKQDEKKGQLREVRVKNCRKRESWFVENNSFDGIPFCLSDVVTVQER
jgi:inorganic pyrophosphatase